MTQNSNNKKKRYYGPRKSETTGLGGKPTAGTRKPILPRQSWVGMQYGKDPQPTSVIQAPPTGPLNVFGEDTIVTAPQGIVENLTGIYGQKQLEVNNSITMRLIDAPDWEINANPDLSQATTKRGEKHPALTTIIYGWREAIKAAFRRQTSRSLSDVLPDEDLQVALIKLLGVAHLLTSFLSLRAIAEDGPDAGIFSELKGSFASNTIDRHLTSVANLVSAMKIPLGYGQALQALMNPVAMRKDSGWGRNAEYVFFTDAYFAEQGVKYPQLISKLEDMIRTMNSVANLNSIISSLEYLPYTPWVPGVPVVKEYTGNTDDPTFFAHANMGVWVPAYFDNIDVVAPVSFGNPNYYSFAYFNGERPSWHFVYARHEFSWPFANGGPDYIHFPGLFPLTGVADPVFNLAQQVRYPGSGGVMYWNVVVLAPDGSPRALIHTTVSDAIAGGTYIRPALHRFLSQIGVVMAAELGITIDSSVPMITIPGATWGSYNEFHDDPNDEVEKWYVAGWDGNWKSDGGLLKRYNRVVLEMCGLIHLRPVEADIV